MPFKGKLGMGMGHGRLVIGDGALGIGHWALIIGNYIYSFSLSPCPLVPLSPHHLLSPQLSQLVQDVNSN